MNCNLCGSDRVKELGLIGLQAVSITSEPNFCSLPAKIYHCQNCNHIQKIYSQTEGSFIDSMYNQYDAYNISRGDEQLIFPEGVSPRTRSYHALEQCISLLPESGKLLDIGTGNGTALKSASQLLKNWKLFAFDIHDKFKEDVLKISGVENFYVGNFKDIPVQKFDLIILWHSLEHIAEPRDFLNQIRDYLTEDGFFLIQVPNIHTMPFDLAVIDHCSHFTKSGLLKLSKATGLVKVIDGAKWTHNCITLLLKRETNGLSPNESDYDSENVRPDSYFDWLRQTLKDFEKATYNRKYAIFGTGISGIWIYSQLSTPPSLFIDEDSERIGHHISNISIVNPKDIAESCDILMPFTYEIGMNISVKMQKLYPICKDCNFILSPPYPERESY